jgi:hypothetical protein
MTESSDLTQIGLSLEGQARLDRFKGSGYFGELRDAYKFAVGFALAKGVVPPEIQTKRQTMFAIATVDPDGSLATAIRELLPCDEVPPYRWAERLAEMGSRLIEDIEASKGFDLGSMLGEADLPAREQSAER